MEIKLGYIILAYFVIITIVAFALMGIDKNKAKKGAFRISEASLFITALVFSSIYAADWFCANDWFDFNNYNKNGVVIIHPILLLFHKIIHFV